MYIQHFIVIHLNLRLKQLSLGSLESVKASENNMNLSEQKFEKIKPYEKCATFGY
jgi:hypothetical protein